MAEFQPFNLGQVLMTAEGIKAARSQSTVDRLREQYMGEQIKTAQFQRESAERQQNIVLGKEKAQQIVAKTGQILQQQNPKNYVEQFEPDLVKNLTSQGVDWATVDDEQLKQMVTAMQNRANQELGVAPLSTQEVGGFNVLQRGNEVVASSAPKASAAPPKSYQEFMLSENDPNYKKFLADNRGKGIRISPDGTIEIGGTGGGVGPNELTNPTVNKLQESIIQATDELDRLNSIGQDFDPKFLQIPGRIKGASLKVKDLAGGLLGDLTPQEAQYLTKFSTFKADAAKNLSAILNRLSGAAISPAEGERLKKGIPNDEDSPTQFIAKYQAAVKDSSRAIMRANWALKNGIGVKSVEQLSQAMPLSGIDEVYSQRANEIWQELGGTPETKAQAVQQANQEFGIAR